MDSTENILKSIVDDYNAIESSNDLLLERCKKIQQSICVIIKQQLLDVGKISSELKKARDHSSQTQTVLDFFYYLLDELPHPVFVPSTEQCRSLVTDAESYLKEYSDFTNLLYSRLVQMVTCMELKQLHVVANKIILLWMQLIKIKNINLYQELLLKLVDLLTELHEIEKSVFPIDVDFEESGHDISLKAFRLTTAQFQNIPPLKITSFAGLERWQSVCIGLLQLHACDLVVSAFHKRDDIWRMVFHQIKFGDFSLKIVSMKFAMVFYEADPSSKIINNFTSCAIPMIEQCAAANDDSSYFEGTCEGEINSYKEALTEFICYFFGTTWAGNQLGLSNLPQPRLQLDVGHTNLLTDILLCDLKPPSCDKACLFVCRHIIITALHRWTGKAEALSLQFISNCHKLTYFLLRESFHDPGNEFLSNVLLYFFVFLCCIDKEKISMNPEAPPSVPKKKSTHPLSRKRHHTADEPKEQDKNKNKDPLLLLEVFQSFCRDLVAEQEALANQYKNQEVALDGVLENTRKHLDILSRLFQPFLQSFTVVKNDNACAALFCYVYKESLISNVFIKCLESFSFVATECSKVTKVSNPDLVVAVYRRVAKLGELFANWLHIVHEELEKPQNQESKKFSDILAVILSLLWLEDFPANDLKFVSTHLLSKTSMMTLSQALHAAGYNELNALKKSEVGKLSIVNSCLTGLALLPTCTAMAWRLSVLVRWSFSSRCLDVEAMSLSLLPTICSKTKPSGMNQIVTEAIGYLKGKKSDCLSDELVKQLATCIQPLMAALLGKSASYTFSHEVDQTAASAMVLGRETLKNSDEETLLLDGNKLLLFVEIERIIFQRLTEADPAIHRPREQEALFGELVVGIATVLQHAPKTDPHAQTLLVKWVKYLERETVTNIKLRFLSIGKDNMAKWHEVFNDQATALFRKALQDKQAVALCNVSRLCGVLARQCAQQNLLGGQLFTTALSFLCKLFSFVSVQVSSTAHLDLEELSNKHVTVFKNHRKKLCYFVAEALVDEQHKSRRPLDVMEDMAHLFNLSVYDFLSGNLQYLLPPTVVGGSLKKREELLSLFSRTSDCPTPDIIMQNFKYIFCHAVVSGFQLEILFKFLEKQTKLKKESLILMTYGSLIQLLMAHMSISNERVCKALQHLHQVESNDDQVLAVSELVKPHFLSLLTYFNGQLRLSTVTSADKKQIFESLICVLYMMEKSDVTAVSVKIVNTVCLAQQVFIDSAHADICCKAWHALVHCVDPGTLGGLLSQVAVMLMPFMGKYPTEVSRILEYLVIDQQEHTRSNIGELSFLPDHSSLKRVHDHVGKELKKNKHNQDNFLNTLEQASKQLSHESVDVRLCALAQLRGILQSNQTALQRHLLASGGTTDFVKRLVTSLLACCRHGNSNVRLLSVKCLGEIGATDPDKLLLCQQNNDGSPPKRKPCFSFEEQDFAFDLLTCLVQAFLAANPIHQDLSAYAIQELLKVFSCKEGPRDVPGRRLWRRFPEQIQVVLEPHLSSRYVLKNSEINLATLKRPMLRRKQNMTFQEWIGSFCAVLMQMASSVSDSSEARGVFEACSAVARNDVNVALFLLPVTVVEVLKCGDQHVSFIAEEVMAVLESTEMLKDTNNDRKSSVLLSSLPSGSISNQDNDGSKAVASSSVASHLSQLSAQAIFSVLDHVTMWHRQPQAPNSGPLARTKHEKERECAVKFLSRVSGKSLAMASLRCRAHKRALLHYETYLRESCGGKCDEASAAFLQRVFIEMNEADGVQGVVNVRGVEPNPETQLLVLESTGALQDAASCYERIIRAHPDDLFHRKGFFKCLIDLGRLSQVVDLVDGTVCNHPNWKNDLNPYAIEACWRLGQWDLLDKKLEEVPSPNKNWSVGIGEALAAVRRRDWKKLDTLLDVLYQNQTGPLSAASMESNSFQRGYSHILCLHLLSDLERFACVMSDRTRFTSLDDVMSLWQLRTQGVQPSFQALEPMMSLSRVALPLLCDKSNPDVDRHVGKLWLQSSKLARKCGHLQTAHGALLSAQPHALPGYCIEHAKLLWKKRESHQALMTLQRGFLKYFNDSSSCGTEQSKERAKVMLLEAKLMEESSFDSNTVLRKYKEVVAYMGEWEDSHFYCGRYYDKLITTTLGESKSGAKAHHLYYIMHHYGRSLCYGTSHIYESLTKLLTLWLDYGATASKLEKSGRPQNNEDVQRLVEVISDVRARLPAYVFYVAFSQLTSRICHPHLATYNQLKEILVSVIQAFPQRALWSMMAISKSSFQQRVARCQEIFERVTVKDRNLKKLISDALALTNRLLELCNKPVTSTQSLSMNSHFRALKRLVEGSGFSEIMLPLQKLMNVTLPQTKEHSALGSQNPHNPFPEPILHIVGFDDAVEVLNSLQRPKKISIRASNGTSCTFLCKPKDDLRKDARLTEFATIVNKCLKRDPESGKRQLRIRSYAVIPLNEECGLIEWVENMKGLRHILLPIYKARGIFCSGKQLKAWQLPQTTSVERKLELFRTKLLPRHPPVLHEWFLTTFTDPSSWYNARLAYARSVAVMSVVGYILGLGDRHGENILFDSGSGEAMHVDFNCLFNKGMHLEVPEIVPFRLTHNMVDAMGPTKYEGFFRKACEVTMNVIREQREPLMSVLKTFIYDPLVEWSKKGRGTGPSGAGETLTEKALTHVNDIDQRLRGVAGKNKGLPLSVKGHVHYLIEEATDEEKLCQMYIGWAPFM